MPEKTWKPEPLREAVWKDILGVGAEQPGGAELQRVLERAEELGGEMNGVAYTTSGAYSVRRARSCGLTTLIEKDGESGSREQEIDLDTVYELRLWRVMDKKTDDGAGEDGLLAHELRWLNGSGAAEIVVGASREGLLGGSDCWVRDNSYLQHGEKGDVMTGIEVFTVEKTYGNTVFTDELMTGRWG